MTAKIPKSSPKAKEKKKLKRKDFETSFNKGNKREIAKRTKMKQEDGTTTEVQTMLAEHQTIMMMMIRMTKRDTARARVVETTSSKGRKGAQQEECIQKS